MFQAGIGLLISSALISGCTVNLYHTSTPALVDESLLVIPGANTTNNSNNSAHSEFQGIPNSANQMRQPANASQTIGLNNNKIATPMQVLSMSATGSGGDQVVNYMDSVALQVQSQVDAYLNCYHEQANGAIVKVFPNRYAERYWVYASQQLIFPDEKHYQFLANTADSTEGFICLLSQEDVLSKLPSVYQASTFQKLPVENFDAVYALYDQATEQNLVARVVSYTIQK